TSLPIMPPDVLAAAQLPAVERTHEQKMTLRQFFRNNIGQFPELDQLRAELAAARTARAEVDRSIPTTLIFRELAEPKPSYILLRGQYDQRGDQVTRRTPESLPPMDPSAPNNRLGLAQWVT